MASSKEQEILRNKLNLIFQKIKVIENFRPDFLKNPKTNKNLELDFYYPFWSVGVEYQGGVHFNKIKIFNNNPDKSRYNDCLKNELLNDFYKKSKFITLIELFKEDLSGVFINKLKQRTINTINSYLIQGLYNHAKSLYCFFIFLDCGIQYRNTKNGHKKYFKNLPDNHKNIISNIKNIKSL